MIDSLLIFAQIKPKPEHYDDAKTAIIGILAQTREEPGCHQFQLNEGLEDDCLYLYEEWQSQAALDDHYAQPYIVSVFDSYESWLAQPVNITKLTKVA